MANITYEVPVPKTDVVIDTHVVELTTTNANFEVAMNGTAFKKSGTKTNPFTPVPLPAFTCDDEVKLQFSSYLLNTLAFNLYD